MRYQSIVGPLGPRLHAALQQAITLGERGDCRIGQPHREHQVCKQRNERWRRRHPTPGSLSPGLIWARCWEWWWCEERVGGGAPHCVALGCTWPSLGLSPCSAATTAIRRRSWGRESPTFDIQYTHLEPIPLPVDHVPRLWLLDASGRGRGRGAATRAIPQPAEQDPPLGSLQYLLALNGRLPVHVPNGGAMDDRVGQPFAPRPVLIGRDGGPEALQGRHIRHVQLQLTGGREGRGGGWVLEELGGRSIRHSRGSKVQQGRATGFQRPSVAPHPLLISAPDGSRVPSAVLPTPLPPCVRYQVRTLPYLYPALRDAHRPRKDAGVG